MYSIPEVIKTIKSNFDYAMFWKFIHVKGIEIYGSSFVLYEEDAHIILKLLCYFLQDKLIAIQNNIELHKGIMLTGPVGCGKTSLFNLMRYLLPAEKRYSIKPCRLIAIDYASNGHEVIQTYTKLSFNSYTFKPATYCFDDLGLEPSVQYYGNECNVMAEILLSRYDYFIQHNMVTHITTNLNSNEIQERYGIRVRSRMRSMFNVIAFNQNSQDKRK